MRTLRNLLLLAGDAARLLRAHAPGLIFWFCLGWSLNTLGTMVSVLLKSDQRVLGTLAFALGVIGWVACLVMMIRTLRPGIAAAVPGRTDSGGPSTRRDHLDGLLEVIGPMMAVYAAWGLAQQQISRLFDANLMVRGLDVDSFSVNLTQWQFYAVVAAIAFVVRTVAEAFADRWRPLTWVAVLAEGLWMLNVFLALFVVGSRVTAWLAERVAWQVLSDRFRALVDLLPELRIWPDLTLPEAVLRVTEALPGLIGNAVLEPLFWLALTATIFGWRDYQGRDLLRGTRLERPADRIASLAAGRNRLQRVSALLTKELREDYLPVLRALRLVWRQGAPFVAAYILLVALTRLGTAWVNEGVLRLIGPQSMQDTLTYLPGFNLLTSGFTQIVLAVVYASAFVRAVRQSQLDEADVPGVSADDVGDAAPIAQETSRTVP